MKHRRPGRLRRAFNRGPVYGPPLPECGERGWRSWYYCEKPLNHPGRHGQIIGTSSRTGGLVESHSVTWEEWT